jgi:hypothetical protein
MSNDSKVSEGVIDVDFIMLDLEGNEIEDADVAFDQPVVFQANITLPAFMANQFGKRMSEASYKILQGMVGTHFPHDNGKATVTHMEKKKKGQDEDFETKGNA